ncbi:13760_t:CDS:2, partial [Dentiscutata erythropus]
YKESPGEKEKGRFVNVCQLCKEKNITVKYTHDSSTGNMLSHLWFKHQIDKEHPDGTNAGGPIVKSERSDRLDGEYLKLVNLTDSEWQLLEKLICLLKPFYNTTTIFSGSTYLTLNLIYPMMRLLIKKFVPSDEQTEDDYADLLPTNKKLKIYRRKSKKISKNYEFTESSSMIASNSAITNDLVLDLYNNEKLDNAYKETELIIIFMNQFKKENVIYSWWQNNAEKFPTLSNLAWKYLSISAISVSSKRLFLDTGQYITVLHNRLQPDMVEQMLFLKHNMEHFSIFKLDEV